MRSKPKIEKAVADIVGLVSAWAVLHQERALSQFEIEEQVKDIINRIWKKKRKS